MKHLVIVAGPSGIGKTYLAQQLLQLYPGEIEQGKLLTTRPLRSDETTPDRLFVSAQEFETHRPNMFIAEQFHNNWYGFPTTLIQSTDKHYIINAWPALIPRFSSLPQITFIGLGVAHTNIGLLEKRMQARNYTEQQMQERLELVRRDLDALTKVAPEIEAHGKVFTIKNDSTINQEVLPWLADRLGLQAEGGVV